MMKFNNPIVLMTDIKNLPSFFVNLEKYKKSQNNKIEEKYEVLRKANNKTSTEDVQDDVNDLTFEIIFLNKLSSAFDGNYFSTYQKLYDMIMEFNLSISRSLNEIEYNIEHTNTETITSKEILAIAKKVAKIQDEYDIKMKYFKQLLTQKSYNEIEMFFKEKFANIASSLVSLELKKDCIE